MARKYLLESTVLKVTIALNVFLSKKKFYFLIRKQLVLVRKALNNNGPLTEKSKNKKYLLKSNT